MLNLAALSPETKYCLQAAAMKATSQVLTSALLVVSTGLMHPACSPALRGSSFVGPYAPNRLGSLASQRRCEPGHLRSTAAATQPVQPHSHHCPRTATPCYRTTVPVPELYPYTVHVLSVWPAVQLYSAVDLATCSSSTCRSSRHLQCS